MDSSNGRKCLWYAWFTQVAHSKQLWWPTYPTQFRPVAPNSQTELYWSLDYSSAQQKFLPACSTKTFFNRTDEKRYELHPQKVWVCFGCKTEASGPDFQLCPFWWYWGPKKSTIFDLNIFQPYWWEAIRIVSKKVLVCFGCKTESYRPRFQLCLLRGYRGPEKSLKFGRNIFEPYWQEMIRTAPPTMGMFLVPNVFILARFSTLVTPVVPEPGKVFKIRPKHFLAIPMGNDKNCIPKSVGMFRVPNIVILTRFSTLVAPVVLGPWKVVKIWSKHFLAILVGNDKNCTPKSVGMFHPYWWKTIRIASK